MIVHEPEDRQPTQEILNPNQFVVAWDKNNFITVCHVCDVRGVLDVGAVVEATPHNFILTILSIFPEYSQAFNFARQFSGQRDLMFVDDNGEIVW